MPFFRGSSPPRDQTWVSCITSRLVCIFKHCICMCVCVCVNHFAIHLKLIQHCKSTIIQFKIIIIINMRDWSTQSKSFPDSTWDQKHALEFVSQQQTSLQPSPTPSSPLPASLRHSPVTPVSFPLYLPPGVPEPDEILRSMSGGHLHEMRTSSGSWAEGQQQMLRISVWFHACSWDLDMNLKGPRSWQRRKWLCCFTLCET